MMGAPLQCSAILVRKKVRQTHIYSKLELSHTSDKMIYPVVSWCQGLLEACNKQCAEYLFQTDKQYDMSYDTGDKTIQCGRHVDVFKLWLMWKAKVPSLSLVRKCIRKKIYCIVIVKFLRTSFHIKEQEILAEILTDLTFFG